MRNVDTELGEISRCDAGGSPGQVYRTLNFPSCKKRLENCTQLERIWNAAFFTYHQHFLIF